MKISQFRTIKAQLKRMSFLVFLVLILNAFLFIWGMQRASQYLERAYFSYEQLGLTSDLEANINRFLLSELASLLKYEETVDLAKTSPALITEQLGRLQSLVAAENKNFPKAVKQGDETLGPSIALGSVFINMYRAANFERQNVTNKTTRQAGQDFFENVVEGKDKTLSRLVHEITQTARKETILVRNKMEQLRSFLGWLSLLAGLLSAGAIGWLIYALSKSILTPIHLLTKATGEFGAGNLAHRVTWDEGDEFSTVASGFNDMAKRLASKRAELEDVNAGLEKSVTERTKELQQAVERLTTIDNSRKRFFANVSHELRTPLTILLGEAEVSLRAKKPKVSFLKESLEHIVANGAFLRRRLSDLLQLARSDEGDISLTKQPLDLTEITQMAVKNAHSYAKANDVELETFIDEGDVSFEGDASWLQHAILVLIDNGVKFSADERRVGIFAKKDNHQFKISVADNGAGLDEESLDRLFERFYQTEEGKSQGGSGLGLAIAKWIVTSHGGTIEARNGKEADHYKGLWVEMIFDLPNEGLG